MLRDRLVREGMQGERILFLNMESLEYNAYREYRSMYRLVNERLPAGGWLLLDEAQEVTGWEGVAAALLADGGIQCVVTGSNVSILRSELGTMLTGRYREIPVSTLSFLRIPPFHRPGVKRGRDESLAEYLRWGGFPAIHSFLDGDQSARSCLSTLLDSILMRDVASRHAIRDPDALRRILVFAFDNKRNLRALHHLRALRGKALRQNHTRSKSR